MTATTAIRKAVLPQRATGLRAGEVGAGAASAATHAIFTVAASDETAQVLVSSVSVASSAGCSFVVRLR